MSTKMGKYQCIECGSEVERLYHDYNTDVVKIQHCEVCHSVADKYIEYEPVIIVLDALLLQPQAYRHLLINTSFTSHWRMALILWICDAFTKLILERSDVATQQFSSNYEYINYAYLGMELYSNYIIAALELFILIGSVLLFYGLRNFVQSKIFTFGRTSLVVKAIILASFGRMLALPALLWGDSYKYLCTLLCHGFVCVSTVQALRVVDEGKYKTFSAVMAVCLGFSTQLLFSNVLYTWLK